MAKCKNTMSARLPDRFDLWVRQARECPDPVRQVDYVLGALAALEEWLFLNTGTPEKPQIARTLIGADPCVFVFSDPHRVAELIQAAPGEPSSAPTLLTIPTANALVWCVENKLGLLINPGDDSVLIPLKEVADFHSEWSQRAGGLASGYWIPSMTSEEEDFWQEHGL
jgi:hypothetical protein